VAVPIFDAQGQPIGALAASEWEPEHTSPERLDQIVQETREAALAVSHALGYAGQELADLALTSLPRGTKGT
jgi:DNA-binding IclR family transcriptional regulator